MTDLEWLIMAGKRASELPKQDADWKWIRFDDRVFFVCPNDASPVIGDQDGVRVMDVKFENGCDVYYDQRGAWSK